MTGWAISGKAYKQQFMVCGMDYFSVPAYSTPGLFKVILVTARDNRVFKWVGIQVAVIMPIRVILDNLQNTAHEIFFLLSKFCLETNT